MSLYTSPSEYRSTHALIAMNAERHPDKIYAVSVDQDGKSLTYGELRDVTNRIAGYLGDIGFEKHDRLLVLAGNSIEFFAAYLGTLRYGATLATVHVETNRAQLARICRAIDPKIVLYQDGLGLEGLRDGGAPGEWMALGEWAADGGGTGFFARIKGYSAANDQVSASS